jgi:predicted RNA methylase
MSAVLDLGQVSAWRERLGLMPVPLRAGDVSRFVLLNGARGNFYLDLPRVAEPTSEFRSNAWSTNVGHGVAVIDREIRVQRWDRIEVEVHPLKAVSEDMEAFHRHLERDVPPSDLSIVAHGVRTFRQLRQAFGQRFAASDVLLAYLLMLAGAVDGSGRSVDLALWDLPHRARDLANEISLDTWAAVSDYLTVGRAIDNLRPDIRLMLRHASGALFQEAHLLATFDAQLQLISTTPRPVNVRRNPDQRAAHFTPASITRSVVERAFHALGALPRSLTIFDPACGSGEFLREALRQLRLSNFTGAVRLVGFDISDAACTMARFSLAAERNTDDGQDQISTDVDIRCADALTVEWPTGVDLILMNPPFAAWIDMPKDTKDTVLRLLGGLAKNRPDLAVPFLMRAAENLKDGGVIGSVVPASMFDGTSSAAIRGALGEMLRADLVARLGSHQLFSGARVDAGLYVAKRTKSVDGVPIALWSDHRETSTSAALRTLRRLASIQGVPVIREGFNIYENESIGHTSESWAPRPYDAWKMSQDALELDLPTVGSMFEVYQGILTGANTVFMLKESDLQRLPRGEHFAFRPAVVNDSIRGGRITSTAWVFYPYGDASLQSEADLRSKLPEYYKTFLLPERDRLAVRQRKSMDDWWTLAEPRPRWQKIIQPKIVTTYFGDRGSFAWDEHGDIAVVQGYAWLARTRRTRAGTFESSDWLALLAILNSTPFSRLLSAHSNHVGGGQWNLSKRFVTPIPAPDVLKLERDLASDIAHFGERIHRGGIESLSVAELEQLDELVVSAYGISSDL